MTDRPTRDLDIDVAWTRPWLNVAEIEQRVDHTRWTLFGGLMVQLHVLASGRDILRPTRDVDMLVHVERPDVYLSNIAGSLTDLGYRERGKGSSLTNDYTEHRWLRDDDTGQDQVDVLVAEHAAPRAYDRRRESGPPRDWAEESPGRPSPSGPVRR